MVLAFVFALGIMGVQFLGLALSAAKVNHAVQEAAFVAGSSLEAASGTSTPCWAVSGGLAHPEGYADAAVCRTVLENVGDLNPDQLEQSLLELWKSEDLFRRTQEATRDGAPFVFYEGPPTANNLPHPGHVLTRVVKDVLPRFKTMQGHYVRRQAGWDTWQDAWPHEYDGT